MENEKEGKKRKSKYRLKLERRRAWARQVGRAGWVTSKGGKRMPKASMFFQDA